MLLLFLLVAVFLGTSSVEIEELQSDLYDDATSRMVFNAKGAGSYWSTMGGEYIYGDQDNSMIGDEWGSELSSDGLTVVYGSDADGVAGGLRVREYDGESWVMKGQAIYGPEDGSKFGDVNTISGDGNAIATGSPYYDDGKVWVYTWSGSAWQPKGTIENTDNFGYVGKYVQLSNDGDSIFVGLGSSPSTARAAVYDWNGSDWVRRGDWLLREGFGGSCGFSGSMARGTTNMVLMYCDGPEDSHIFMWNGTAWEATGSFNGPHGYNGDVKNDEYWGQQNAISDDGMYVMMSGMYMYDPEYDLGNDDESQNYHGGFQVIKWTGSNWVPHGDIVFGSADDAEGTYYGASMSRDGSTVCMSQEIPHYVVVCHMYDESKDKWVSKGMPLTITPEAQRLNEDSVGNGMSLNNDGSILVFGCSNYDLQYLDGDNRGAVFIFQWHESFLKTQGATKRVLALQAALGSGVSEFKWNKIQLNVGKLIYVHSERETEADAVTAFFAWYDITKTAYTFDNFNNLKTAVDTFVSDNDIAIVDPAATVWMYDDYRRRKM